MHILSTCICNPGVGAWTDQGSMLRIRGDRLYCLPIGVGMIHNNEKKNFFQVQRKEVRILDSRYLIPVFVSRTWIHVIMDSNNA